MPNEQPITRALRSAIDAQDPEAFEDALERLPPEPMHPDIVLLLIEALPMTWHERHEDLARTLQDERDPRAIEALFQTALSTFDRLAFKYLAYDDGAALARKCVWALADIGTPEAKSRLETLAKDHAPELAAYATKRLRLWQDELSRKGPRGTPGG